jgi:uncharacterized protein (DUF4213/DUF364 family)
MFEKLMAAFKKTVAEHGLEKEPLKVRCRALTVDEAIGNPEENDYPIQRGKEKMVQAEFRGHFGQAFSCEISQGDYTIEEVLKLPLKSDWERAVFLSALNAVYAALGITDRTIHCKDQEPIECASKLCELVEPGKKVALFGLQPRFLEKLKELGEVRCVDLDPDLVNEKKGGVLIEPVEKSEEVMGWCDLALVTGSATVNDSFDFFLNRDKPVHVFGTTGAATAGILNLPRFCHCAK